MAVQMFTVKDIKVSGIHHIELSTILGSIPVHIGESFTDNKSEKIVKKLYRTGFFRNIQVTFKHNIVTIKLEERPLISKINFSGVSEFNKNHLVQAMKKIGIGNFYVFNKEKIHQAEQELIRYYLLCGLYGTRVKTDVVATGNNRVRITFIVNEGTDFHVRKISFIGNKIFSDKELNNQIKLHTQDWFALNIKASRYVKEKLLNDLKRINQYYLNHGYIRMAIDSTKIAIDSHKKDVYITVTINEGEKYKVSRLRMRGKILGHNNELRSLINLEKDEVFNAKKLEEGVGNILDKLSNSGYAFASVSINPELDREEKKVSLTLFIDPNKRTYVRRINIAGNTKTHDRVIRREFRQLENSWYDGSKIKLSRDRVRRLGYFKDVFIDTSKVKDTSNQVDINMSVTEQPTGSFQIGAGFSQTEKISFFSSIQKQNIFGSGNAIGLDINTNRYSHSLSFSQVSPYITKSGMSRTYNAYYSDVRHPRYISQNQKVRTFGAKIKYGMPYSEKNTVFFGIGAERISINSNASSPLLYQQYVTDFGNGTLVDKGLGYKVLSDLATAATNSFPLTIAWESDSRNSVLAPTKGCYQRANLEISPFGTTRYYRASYQHQYFKPFFSDSIILAVNSEIDYGSSISSKPYPLFKNYHAGGIGTVRGFENSSLGFGTSVDQYGNSMGGTSRAFTNLEIQFPLLESSNERALHWFIFLDGGQVYADKKPIQLSKLRYSAGLGLSWISPIGPLKISYGKPLNAISTDRQQSLQFQVGTGF